MPCKYLFPILGSLTLLVILTGSLAFAFKDNIFPKTEVLQNQNIENTSNSSQTQSNSSKTEATLIEKPGIKPLVADANYDVVVLDECDLAVKYPKKINDKILAFQKIDTETYQLNYPILESEDFNNESIPDSNKPSIIKSIFTCNNIKISNSLNYVKQDLGFRGNLSSEDLQKITGWNLSDATNISAFASAGFASQNNFWLTLNNKNYGFYLTTKSDNKTKLGIFPDQIQIQPNSLAPSTPSVKVGDASKTPQIKPLVADDTHDVVVLDECDLAVRYNKSLLKPILKDSVFSFRNLNYDPVKNIEEYGTELQCQDKPFDDVREFGPLNDNLKDREDYLANLGIPQAKNFKQNLFIQGNSEFYFELNGKYYRVFQVLRTSDDYRLQPNSLAPSTPSVKVKDLNKNNDKT